MSNKPDNCTKCKHHEVISDPDPDDNFCSDDVAVICKLMTNPRQDANSKYVAHWQQYRCVTLACRPYRVGIESAVPEWCPL